MAGNREVKSDVFGMLLEDPQRALEVYNALNNSDYRDPGMVEMCTLERGISLTVRNDASFVVGTDLNVYEHESTVCPNMPLRALIYTVSILERKVKDQDLYGRRLVKIPAPHFAVFYNGVEKQPEQYEMRLSDAFADQVGRPELELICRGYNINKGMNQDLLRRCPTLGEYAVFVDYVRKYQKECADLGEAINVAIDRCIREDVLREFLIKRRWEVTKVIQLDYTFDRRIELERNYAEQERQAKEQERQAKEQERRRADLAETENQRLREELERYKKMVKD